MNGWMNEQLSLRSQIHFESTNLVVSLQASIWLLVRLGQWEAPARDQSMAGEQGPGTYFPSSLPARPWLAGAALSWVPLLKPQLPRDSSYSCISLQVLTVTPFPLPHRPWSSKCPSYCLPSPSFISFLTLLIPWSLIKPGPSLNLSQLSYLGVLSVSQGALTDASSRDRPHVERGTTIELVPLVT